MLIVVVVCGAAKSAESPARMVEMIAGPATVGVPDSEPSVVNVSPVGNGVRGSTLKVAVGTPAVNTMGVGIATLTGKVTALAAGAMAPAAALAGEATAPSSIEPRTDSTTTRAEATGRRVR